MTEVITDEFYIEGVLPLEQELPKFSVVERRLGMSHQDWINTFLSRLVQYDIACYEAPVQVLPLAVTELGAQAIVTRYADQTRNKPYAGSQG